MKHTGQPRPGKRASIVILSLMAAGAAAAHSSASQERGPVGRLVFEIPAAGIDFVHDAGTSSDKHLPETMGSGVAWLDFDADGRQDLYLVQSGAMPGTRPADELQPGNALYRNRGDGTFAAARSGAEDTGYGMGVTVADYDNDGWPDLYVANFGANALYRNNGDGSFTHVVAGVEDPLWSSSAAWGDLDNDGDADLYVVNYVIYDPATAVPCGDAALAENAYCHIDLFDGARDSLYRNDGDGTFTDVTEAAGVANARQGKGLGVVMGDVNGDSATDVYVANDTEQNFLYLNRTDWLFEDQGLFSGTGYSDEGRPQAGMGTDLVDLDGEGGAEILVANFSFENNNLFREFAPGSYLDDAFVLGFGEPGFATLSFGLAGIDVDGDGDRDIAVANGHILDTVEPLRDGTAYAQPNHLFRNLLSEQRRERAVRDPATSTGQPWRPAAGLFELVDGGPGFELVEVSRGLAAGDANGDGRPDLLISNSGGPARLLLNATPGGRALVLRLRGRTANRDAFGARVVVTPVGADPAVDGAAGFPQTFEVRSASSYQSQSATDLYVGLGGSDRATVRVVWPDGDSVELGELPAGHVALVIQGRPPVLGSIGS